MCSLLRHTNMYYYNGQVIEHVSGHRSLHMRHVAHQVGAFSDFCCMNRVESCLLPLGGMLVHHNVAPQR